MAMSTKKQQERRKFWIRVICAGLAVILVLSTFISIFLG